MIEEIKSLHVNELVENIDEQGREGNESNDHELQTDKEETLCKNVHGQEVHVSGKKLTEPTEKNNTITI